MGVMQKTGTEGAFLGVHAFDGIKTNLVELHRFGVPIGWALLHHHSGVDAPFLEGEGAVAHVIFRQRPTGAAHGARAVFLDGARMHGPE